MQEVLLRSPMRALAIPIMLVLAGLATLPGAHADPVPDACPERHLSSKTTPEHTVDTSEDCSAVVELNKGVICVGAWTRTDTYQAGPVTIISHGCDMPGGTGPGDLIAMDGPCGQDYTNGVVSVSSDADCSVHVDMKTYDCAWGGTWYTVVDAGPLTVREYRCYPPGGDPA